MSGSEWSVLRTRKQKMEDKRMRRWEGWQFLNFSTSQLPNFLLVRLTSHLLHLTVVTSILLAGCGTGRQAVKPSNVVPADASGILRSIEEGKRSIDSLKGMARIGLSNGKMDKNADEVVVVKRPSGIRLETLSFFGNPLMVFASNGEEFNIAAGERFIKGKLSSKRMVSLPFPFNLLRIDEITTIFLGSTPIMEHERSELAYSGSNNRYILTLHSKDGFKKQVIDLDAETLRLISTEIADEGVGSILTITFGSYQEISNRWFPKDIDVHISPNPSNLHIVYGDIELNQNVDESLFLLVPAEGADVVTLH